MPKKGQGSLEQLLMTALGLTFIGIVLFFAMNFANDAIRVSQAQDAVDKLAKSADYVDSLGPMSQDVVDIYVPEGLRFVTVSDDRVMMRISLSSGDADLYAHTHAELIGDIPRVPGPQEVTITATPDGRIRFGNAALMCLPSTITRTFTQGDVDSDSFSVTNVGDFEITDITAALTGNIYDILTINQPDGTLDIGDTDTVGLDFDVPSNKEKGVYTGWVTVIGSNGTECATAVTITLFVTELGASDDVGPLVTYLQSSPENPEENTTITIDATGNDTNRGNSSIEFCQIELDYSGIWNDMDPADGAYDEIVEDVTFDLGMLREGTHTVRVRCVDSALNIGPAETHTIYIGQIGGGGGGEGAMLIITLTSNPDTPEEIWLNWIDTHNSGEGLNWSYDRCMIGDVKDGSVDIYDYGLVIMADSPNADEEFYSLLSGYTDSGGYIIFFGEGLKFALEGMGVAGGNSQSGATDYLWMEAHHYITEPFTVGLEYQVTTGNDPVYYNIDYTGFGTASLGGECFCCTCDISDDEVCVEADGGGSLDVYIPMEEAASGTYPAQGTVPNTVTVTESDPVSSGYLYAELLFENLPENMVSTHIALTFLDLDLQGEIINYGNRRGTLTESFTLLDPDYEEIITLDSSYPEDDNFVWDYYLDRSLFNESSVVFPIRLNSTLELTDGSYVTVTNSLEGIRNIQVCGTAMDEGSGCICWGADENPYDDCECQEGDMAIFESSNVLVYGVTRPNRHTGVGEQLATRVIDYGLGAR